MVGSLTLLKLTFSLSIVKGSRRERWIGERPHMTAFPNFTSAQYYLDFSSHHAKEHKISTASTLLFRASNLPSSFEGKTCETNHVRTALEANGYPPAVISNILNKKPPPSSVPPPEELVSMFFKWADPSNTYQGFACLPYISSLTEPLTR